VPLSFSSLFPPISVVAETFADGPALFDAVCKLGLEGVVAKRLSSRYRASQRGWVKTKNRTTGVATPSARRCSARGSVVSELACSALRAERHQVAAAIGVVAPALRDGRELVNFPPALRTPNRVVHGGNLPRVRRATGATPSRTRCRTSTGFSTALPEARDRGADPGAARRETSR
jgi:ATP-dependent DNA ligase